MDNVVGIALTSASCDGPVKQRVNLMETRYTQPNRRERKMNVAVYVRVSTLRQQQAQTIEQQLERLQAHIAVQSWSLAEEHIFRDDGYSGAKLNRPGLDSLRDRAAMAEFELVLITSPDRLARKYVHQALVLEELESHGCRVEFLDRPMSDDPHDQLVLQIRGAVAEYERALIADRMRRGRLMKLRAGQLLPWTRAPYGYILDAERPRDPARVRVNGMEAAIVRQIFAWYTDLEEKTSLYAIAKRLSSDDGVPTPNGGQRWNASSIRGILTNPAYTGTAYANRTRTVPARQRKSALLPVGPGVSHRPRPKEEWIPIPVPAIISQEQFDQAQARLALNQQIALRNNTQHWYLLRGLVSCGQCRLSCIGRSCNPGYSYYVCRGKTDALRASQGERCLSRYTPADALDDLVWQDLCHLLTHPELITQALERAQGGKWLPQQLQARSKTLKQALAQLARQEERLLEAYLAEVIALAELERKRQEIAQKQKALQAQLRQLEAQAEKRIEVAAVAASIETFCQRIQQGLEQATFAQRRQLVELLIDRVVVDDGQVEIRYVIPTSETGAQTRFCHLRTDYFM
jgi:site-specific DNA recombinase